MSRAAYRAIEEGGRADWRVAFRLMRYVLPHRWIVSSSIAVLVLLSVLKLVSPYAVTLAVDRGIIVGDVRALLRWGLVFAALAAMQAVAEYARTRLTILTGQRVIYDVRGRLFRHIHRLPVRYFDRTPVGTMVTRVTSDVEEAKGRAQGGPLRSGGAPG